MALHSRYPVTVSAAVATRSRADCSSMEDGRGNKRPYQPKHSPSFQLSYVYYICVCHFVKRGSLSISVKVSRFKVTVPSYVPSGPSLYNMDPRKTFQ